MGIEDQSKVCRVFIDYNFSLNVMFLTSNRNSTVAIGAASCALATMIRNSSRRPLLYVMCGDGNPILRKSASGMALDKTLMSISPTMFNFLISIKKCGFLPSLFNGKVD